MSGIISLFAIYLAIFLFGMACMRIGLYNLAEKNLKQWLLKFTDTPLKGLLAGTAITALLQSSSAVMVIVIGLVAASYLTFQQSIGIILGANIGTTVTNELITINIYDWIIPILIIGAIFLIQSNKAIFCIGAIFFGLGSIFTAMKGFESIAIPLASSAFLHSALASLNTNSFLGISVGTILTLIIQSSTAATGITMGFLNEDLLTLKAGIAIVLGANIGTCVTALIASIGSKHEAKLTAMAHVWLNVIGVLLTLPFIGTLEKIVTAMSTLPNVQLAHSSVLFNIASSIIALLFIKQFCAFVLLLHDKKSYRL